MKKVADRNRNLIVVPIARDVDELLQAANLLRAVAGRRHSEALHELASCVQRYMVATFAGEG